MRPYHSPKNPSYSPRSAAPAQRSLFGLFILVTVPPARNNGSQIVREAGGLGKEYGHETETTDGPVKAAMEHMKKKLEATHIYLLGKRTTAINDSSKMYDLSGEEIRPDQYWLFGITPTAQGHPVPQIIKALERQYAPLSLCIGTATQKDLRKKIRKGDRFLKNILYRAQPLYRARHATPLPIPPQCPTVPHTEIRKAVGTRYLRARNLLDRAGTIMDDPLLELVTMAMATEQLCLGLLYAVWQHTPINGTLDHYIKLVSMFWPKIMDHYPRATRTDCQQLSLLLNARSQWQSSDRDREMDEILVGILHCRTMEFMEDSRSFVDGIC